MMEPLAEALRPFVLSRCQKSPCTIFLSATDMHKRAITRHAHAEAAETAWDVAMAALTRASNAENISPSILRADWVVESEAVTWEEFLRRMEATRRNYFRHGVALTRDWSLAFTEMECNANAMFYVASDTNSKGQFNERNAQACCRRRFERDWPQLAPDSPVTLFTTEGAFVMSGGGVLPITGKGLDAGRRDVPEPTPELYMQLAHGAAHYLARQCKKDGRYDYGWFSCFDRPIPTYNTLRHISTTWSLLEAYGAFKEPALRDAIVRATDDCVKTFARRNGEATYFEDVESGECKLGSNGCALIMLTRYTELLHTKRYLPLMRSVAKGILAMQEEDGGFVHVLNSKDFSLAARHRIVYYDGEAVFGLLRLFSINKDETLLAAARRAFDHFIATDHWKNHDHWLSYSVNELTRYDPQPKYFQFGIQNFNGYLDFVRNRDTAYPTLLELMLAADEMLRRLDALPEMANLLAQIDRRDFTEALESRAHQLLNGYFWPEFAMFFKNPAKIVDSFFIKHHAFRVRIDDVQHFLTGFIGYAEWLQEKLAVTTSGVQKTFPYYRINFPESALQSEPGHCWGAAQLAEAASGTWHTAPPPNWYANAIISSMGYLPLVPEPAVFVATTAAHCAHHLRIRAKGTWDSHTILQKNWQQFIGAIVEHPVDGVPKTFPQLVVRDGYKALMELGMAARQRFKGKVIGVTGSVGKTTTCDMLRYVLEAQGSVMATYASHNNKIGVPSVFASVPADANFVVLEMSIPSFDMIGGSCSQYLRPHVAMVTQIAEAHLDQWKTLENVARLKARIFDGIDPGGYAVINGDMPCRDYFVQKARGHGLEIVLYGSQPDARVRLLDVDSEGMRFCVDGSERSVSLAARGRHMAMNACGVMGVLLALGLEVEENLERLASFRAIAGRGRLFQVLFEGKRVSVVDESYNASPASMRAALETMALT
ncbi:MAG: UDP-N-acetylmuramoyl-tripeptide--D-alanyl-D-alanine ligase, partial [Desulfovibrio sp.]|nr:UDP-N-acetylmuramoyl-tripeptide--D-alanyl-D-alanine ligase [Desulfovibrio sp.]